MNLQRNMGVADRLIRPTLATALVVGYATGKVRGATGIGLLALATIFTLTSAVGWCPMYEAVGINTLPKSR